MRQEWYSWPFQRHCVEWMGDGTMKAEMRPKDFGCTANIVMDIARQKHVKHGNQAIFYGYDWTCDGAPRTQSGSEHLPLHLHMIMNNASDKVFRLASHIRHCIRNIVLVHGWRKMWVSQAFCRWRGDGKWSGSDKLVFWLTAGAGEECWTQISSGLLEA